MEMYIQEKVAWDEEIDQKLALLKTLGVDCIAIELPDAQREHAAVDLSTLESATAFFKTAKAKVEAHGMELRTVLATSGLDEIKRGVTGRDQKIASLLNAVQAMGAAGRCCPKNSRSPCHLATGRFFQRSAIPSLCFS